VLAESVQFDGTAVAIFIAIAVVIIVVGVGALVLGFVLAPRAARGSQTAMGWWVVALAVEAFPTLGSFGSFGSGGFHWSQLIMPAILTAQIGLFLWTKRNVG
jgi:hypothetical protein